MSSTKTPMQECPTCKGDGKRNVLANFGNDGARCRSGYATIACDFCAGEGKVTEEQINLRQIGAAMREERVPLKIPLRAYAAYMGIKPSALSQMERGIPLDNSLNHKLN